MSVMNNEKLSSGAEEQNPCILAPKLHANV